MSFDVSCPPNLPSSPPDIYLHCEYSKSPNNVGICEPRPSTMVPGHIHSTVSISGTSCGPLLKAPVIESSAVIRTELRGPFAEEDNGCRSFHYLA